MQTAVDSSLLDQEDHALLTGFLDGSLPPSGFNHAAHLRVARAWLLAHNLPAQLEGFHTALARYAAGVGAAGKYHATVTEGLLILVRERLQARPGDGWAEFRDGWPALFTDALGVLAQHYSAELLASDTARQQVCAPDRAPLPCGAGPHRVS